MLKSIDNESYPLLRVEFLGCSLLAANEGVLFDPYNSTADSSDVPSMDEINPDVAWREMMRWSSASSSVPRAVVRCSGQRGAPPM